jgi:hypothetical protein
MRLKILILNRLHFQILFFFYLLLNSSFLLANTFSLNGEWEIGSGRNYTKKMYVPGLVTEPDQMNSDTLWYKKEIILPSGDWQYATLILKGALFSPKVYINSQKVAEKNGGLAPTFHLLNHKDVKPDNRIIIEIALLSLKDIPETDASYVAKANHWRSNISSLIWDDIILKTHGKFRISRIIPFNDIGSDQIRVYYEIDNIEKNQFTPNEMICEIIDKNGKCLIKSQKQIYGLSGDIILSFQNRCKLWSPENPNLYKLKLTLKENAGIVDTETISYGLKEFTTEGIQFKLNGNPYKVRAGTVVWHRWIRDPEAKYIAFNEKWFEKNIVKKLKDRGANTLRFHLGNPPEKFLDLCDRYGLLVQYEWGFFHGMPASQKSLIEQWRNWLDLSMRHPSISLIHPYNETSGSQLKTLWSALKKLIKDYPPLVLEERDVIHIHKYWWSLFENVGLYYDHASEFSKPIMVDEFGGNYLDGYGNLGGYKTLKRTYLRFCGRDHDPAIRLYHHSISNSQIAEYWRRIGAAGFSPFCIVGSWEDGNHWYLGKLKNGFPKDVWNALTSAFSPVSVSLEIWDRNFYPDQEVKIPLYIFNDTEKTRTLNMKVYIETENESKIDEQFISMELPAFRTEVQIISIKLPSETGKYTFKAHLLNPPLNIKFPVISQWDFRIIKPTVSHVLKIKQIGILSEELELNKFLNDNQLSPVDINHENFDLIIGSRKTWKKIIVSSDLRNKFNLFINQGKSIVLLDVGPQYYGQGYSDDPDIRLGFLQGSSKIKDSQETAISLFGGLKLNFKIIAEPESHIHPSKITKSLWTNLKYDYTWLWNGMRGGIIAPAVDMRLSGLSPAAFITQWKSRGADKEMFTNRKYYAYDLNGFYGYSTRKNDRNIIQELRNKVKFLVDDAPALAGSIDPDANIDIINLADLYKNCKLGKAEKLIPLVNCGINLLRTPVVQIDFGKNKGAVIISQLITEGRLAKGYGEPGLYGKRYDPVVVQFVLNMLALSII